jgi:diguanylate cyclase (GGDEF)-like protein
VIDDEPLIRDALVRILAAEGHEVEATATRAEAEERLARGSVDVALCDLRLGATCGVDLIRLIASRHRNTRAVAVTGMADSQAVAEAFQAGAVGYVTKPFKASDIAIAVHQALRSRAIDAAREEERRHMEHALRERADRDPLTGLFNRRRFAEELERYLRLRPAESHGALVLCDLDNFKVVNETLGHAAGDGILRRSADALRARLRNGDVVARLGGDEFAILLTDIEDEAAVALAHDLQQRLAAAGTRPPGGASVGVACFSGDEPVLADDLMAAADAAVFEVKEAGRNAVARCDGRRVSSLTWIERIQRALDEDGFVLHSQPIVDVGTGQVAGEELLVRMRDDDGTLIAPGAFLPTAEQFGLVERIDVWCLERALDLAQSGRPVNVNVSARTMVAGRFIEAIEARVRAGLEPRLVTIEITETCAVSEMRLVGALAKRLSALGCKLALDDFGTGFGALTYLKHLPVDVIKIDAEFVRDLAGSASDRRMIKAIVEIARAGGQRTVAEGVEDAMSLGVLQSCGVDFAQGYFLARPSHVGERVPGLAAEAADLYRPISRSAA